MSCHELSHSCHTQKSPIRTASQAALHASCHSCHELSHDSKVVTTHHTLSLSCHTKNSFVTTATTVTTHR